MRYLILAAFLILPLASCSRTGKSHRGLDSPTEYHLKKGQLALTDKDYDAAVSNFDAVLTMEPANMEALLGRGRAYAGKDNLDQAIADYTSALAIDPKLGRAYWARCLAYAAKEEYGLASVDMNQAQKYGIPPEKMNPEFAAVYARHGLRYWQALDYQKAKENFEMALHYDATPPTYHYRLGLVYLQLKNWDAAIQQLNEAGQAPELKNKVDRELALAYLGRARMCQASNNPQQAAADFDEALRLDPNLKPYQREFNK